ncbi:MAG: hypothetical protein E6J90_05300 [Deltaproteobacteria bacterium]|nr:MAG: hypothetical protein E6J91_35420 [Deltaproteobacteria bacterium]TMQ25827.1 MAG: hypothetical protein E6J90_05300 [Deltaproteobacteria bacterium]
MLVVVSHAGDAGAHRLVERWQGHGARLLVARDLCRPGWRHYAPGGDAGRAMIGGAPVPVAEIRGVVTRVPHIRALDLPQIVAEDREYVAAELNAFLTAWLDTLPCPVLNRPSAGSLIGPAFSHERWLVAAARAGISVATRRHRAPALDRPPAMAIATVVGERWFGAVEPEVGAQAVRLARAAGVELLTVRFTSASPGAAFTSADLLVDVTPEIADAILARMAQLAESRR